MAGRTQRAAAFPGRGFYYVRRTSNSQEAGNAVKIREAGRMILKSYYGSGIVFYSAPFFFTC
jgi:hypothetical protein